MDLTPERWRQFEDLFHAARERASGDREAFLVEACAGDATLRREVESLLAQQDGTLLREGVAAVAATLVTSLARHNHEGARSARICSAPSWAAAEWATSIARGTRSWAATSPWRSCPTCSGTTRSD